MDIESTTDGGAGFDIGWFTAGEWMKYNVKIDQAGTYNIDFRVSNQLAGGGFHLEVDGVNVTGLMSVPATTNFQIFQTITKTGVALTAGNHVLRLVGDTNAPGGSVMAINWLKLTQHRRHPGRADEPGRGGRDHDLDRTHLERQRDQRNRLRDRALDRRHHLHAADDAWH